jgi:hypothetical protein
LRTTQLLTVNGDVARRYWALYEEAFAGLRTMSPCRQYLTEAEFLEEMGDERIIKFVLWDADDPVAILLVARDLSAVPWISPDYFAARYPEHYASGRIYYVGALVTAPHERRAGNASELMLEFGRFIGERKAVLAYDCGGVNAEFLPAVIRQLGDTLGVYREDKLDAQHYYAIEGIAFHSRRGRFAREAGAGAVAAEA